MSVCIRGVRAILTDIEGTISSIAFVKDVLFPYARAHLPAYLAQHRADPEVRRWLSATAAEVDIADADSPQVVAALLRWIDEDRKATPLKALQGMVWREGYETGAYVAHVYPEVPDRLRAWKAQGLPLYVYSSGSVAAQKLFFSHSGAGDLAPLVDGWFDTGTGSKREPASYARIASAIGMPAREIAFLSDLPAELDASRAAGMRTVRLCRTAEHSHPGGAHPCAASFDAIELA